MRPQAARNSSTVPPATSKSRGWAHWITLVLLLFTCVAARLVCLACKPFWFDEAFSVEVARLSWPNFLHLLWWREANMSLYYLLLRVWLEMGHSPYFIRSLSVIITAATLPAVYWLARLLFGQRVALISVALFAFNAYDVRYSQEARSYSLFLLLATLSSGLLVWWLGEPLRRNLRGYIAASVLAVYAHLYALLLTAVHWLVLRLTCPPQVATGTPVVRMRRAWWTISILVFPCFCLSPRPEPDRSAGSPAPPFGVSPNSSSISAVVTSGPWRHFMPSPAPSLSRPQASACGGKIEMHGACSSS